MKFFLSLLLVSFFYVAPNLVDVRTMFEKAANNKENTQKLYQELEDYQQKNQTILAYKGASEMLYSRYNGNKEIKKKLLTNGSNLIENSIKSDPKNIEIRLIRFILQENLPKAIHYNKNFVEDRQLIVNQYKNQTKEVKSLIKKYSKQSKTFTAKDKANFN